MQTQNENMSLTIIILAAGAGKRMKSSKAKVLHSLGGRTLLQHVIDTSRKLNPEKICVVIGHCGDQVRQEINDQELCWAKQEQQLGTGHALMQAQHEIASDGMTLILYGDVPLTRVETLRNLLSEVGDKQCGLLTVNLDDPTGYGRIIRDVKTRAITSIVEHKDASEFQRDICEVNTGIMLVPNKYLHQWLPKLTNENTQGEYYLTDVIALAVKENIQIKIVQPSYVYEVLGVNDKKQLADLERIFQLENANELLKQGVSLADPARIDIRGSLLCDQDVSIDINCIFEGTVELQSNVKIGAHCFLKNVKIASDSTIQPYSHIENAEIGEDCKIGPFARIRPGTKLMKSVHVGNFVEVKNSQIGNGSKANHLSYLGDSIVGANVNVGAGTITCNYDGANKHQTVIEDDVFIGSDTQLVAPIRISKGTTIGAGSTITRDTPENALTLSRAKQISITGWKRPRKS